jgi:N-acetylmuramoyl-L-alanine amidase
MGLALAMAPWAVPPSFAAVAVTAVRVGEYTGKTRVVLEMSARVGYQVFALADPYRIVIDLPEMVWRLGPARAVGNSLVATYRYGLFQPGHSRMVIDMRVPVAIVKHFILSPRGGFGYRLVLDFRRIGRSAFLRSMVRPEKRPARRAAAPRSGTPPSKPGDGRHVIAIDPGHGGVDPGAIGRSGAREKRITLAQAQILRRQLERTGRYRVVMTRYDDRFVRLRARIAIARAAEARLFISLHADSMRNRRIRGGAVYTLSETASDREAAALAAKENRADLIAGIDLRDQSPLVAKILIDLRQRLTKNESVIFAKYLIRELGKTTQLLRNNHRFAGFAVLKAPEVPSVLIEMGYLSNASDERLLQRERHQWKVGAAIVKAVDRYFASQQARTRP